MDSLLIVLRIAMLEFRHQRCELASKVAIPLLGPTGQP
jgi:hypothetical protein